MLAYVLDAWASTADGAAAGRPVVVYSPAVAAVTEAFAERASFALQEEPRGTGDAVAGRPGRSCPTTPTEILVLSGDVPLVTGADLDAILEARRADDAAIALASVFAAEPAQLGRVVRGEFGTVERIVEAKDATAGGAGRQRDQRRPLRVRRRLAAPPDRGPRAVAGDRRALPDRPRPARPRGRPDRQRGRVRGRRPLRRDQRSLAAGGRRMEPARPPQRGPHAQRGHDARPVDGLPRLDGRPRRRRDPRAERHPARRDDGRRRQRHRAGQPAGRCDDRSRGARLGEHRRVVDRRGRRHGRAVQPPAAGQRGRGGRRGRQLRRAQEHAPGRRVEAAPHELPRRRRDRRARQHRRRHDHRQLRRDAQAPDHDRRRRVHRRRHHARRADHASARARGPEPARS